MERIEVEMFATAASAVIRLPGRSFPGVVIQGDTLFSLLQEVQELQAMAAGAGKPDLERAISCLKDNLRERVEAYEAALRIEGMSLPY